MAKKKKKADIKNFVLKKGSETHMYLSLLAEVLDGQLYRIEVKEDADGNSNHDMNSDLAGIPVCDGNECLLWVCFPKDKEG